MPRYRRSLARFLVLATLAVLGCRVTSLPLWNPVEPDNEFAVDEIRDVPYVPEASSFRHTLDLILPRMDRPFPTVILVHGGGWAIGDNRCCGLYPTVGKYLASRGIGVVIPNYRQSPWVRHPEHAKDLARVVAWTRDHAGDYGGSAANLFLAGHSAGGHLVSLLATDPSYLQEQGIDVNELRGVIAISGVYRLPEGNFDVTLGGESAQALRLDEFVPIRGDSISNPLRDVLPPIPVSVNAFSIAFGNDPETRRAASPITHARPGLPPFLLVAADKDLPTFAVMAREFHEALVQQGCDAHLIIVTNRNHNTIMFRAIADRDPVAQAMVEFIAAHQASADDHARPARLVGLKSLQQLTHSPGHVTFAEDEISPARGEQAQLRPAEMQGRGSPAPR